MRDILLSIPNVSEGSDPFVIASIRGAYETAGAVVLDEHSDADHGRSVHTLAGPQGVLSDAIEAGYRVASSMIKLDRNDGVHPHVGVMDVAPFVYLDSGRRGAACAEALTAAGKLERAGSPVFLYGLLGDGRSRAELRRGGLSGLNERVMSGSLRPDFGPASLSPKTGAVLCGARPPLVAFNLLLEAGESFAEAEATAVRLREATPGGLPGVRALALQLASVSRVQLSFNLEQPQLVGIREVYEAVSAEHQVTSGELIGLAQEAVIGRIPGELEMPDFDPQRRSVEGCLRFHGITD